MLSAYHFGQSTSLKKRYANKNYEIIPAGEPISKSGIQTLLEDINVELRRATYQE